MTLPAAFYARPAEALAPALLGQTLVHGDQRVRIVETEAYVGPHDQAAHSRFGRTKRTEVMFGPPGHAYVYLIYGIHPMCNVVAATDGDAQAVLIRAAEPLAAIEGRTDGPGRLAKALGLSVQAHNGVPLTGDLRIEAGSAPRRIERTPRIGVDSAGDWAQAPLRFIDVDSPCLSRPLRSVHNQSGSKPPEGSRLATGSAGCS